MSGRTEDGRGHDKARAGRERGAQGFATPDLRDSPCREYDSADALTGKGSD